MPDGNSEQTRIVAEQVADAAITRFAAMRKLERDEVAPRAQREVPVPPLIKWVVGAVATFGSAALIGLGMWLVTSVSTMRETLARMDERMLSQDSTRDNRFDEFQRRIEKLEAYHAGGGER